MNIAVIGTGKIIPTAIEAFQQIKSYTVKAIYGRPHSMAKAQDLAMKYQIEKVYTDYDELLDDADIDLVYIGLVNSAHYEYSRKALLASKNIIVEKPFCSSLAEAEDLQRIAKKTHTYLFEAVTLLHMPNIRAIQEVLPLIGKIRLVNCNYSQYSSRYDRYLRKEIAPAFDVQLSGGALMDINLYNIDFVLGLFGRPMNVQYNANLGFNGIDTSGVLSLTYPDFIAVCIGAKDSASPNYCTIQGEKGWLQVIGGPNEFKGFELHVNGKTESHYHNLYENRMVHEFIEFAKIITDERYDEMKKYLTLSIYEMEVMDKARMDAGIPIISVL
ncbi:MAG: Gfo/Idh/MocA family oxidoreductase [Phocaeicola sp.]|nr:Gfo/Idh/MocA family oxidoreductase [Phocaeicola sp.]